VTIKGRERQAKVREAESIDEPKPMKITKSDSPKSPNTTDGTPASARIDWRRTWVKKESVAYSEKYNPVPTPTGTVAAIETAISSKVPTKGVQIPPAVIPSRGGSKMNSQERAAHPRSTTKPSTPASKAPRDKAVPQKTKVAILSNNLRIRDSRPI
jgi:hypothetical protein